MNKTWKPRAGWRGKKCWPWAACSSPTYCVIWVLLIFSFSFYFISLGISLCLPDFADVFSFIMGPVLHITFAAVWPSALPLTTAPAQILGKVQISPFLDLLAAGDLLSYWACHLSLAMSAHIKINISLQQQAGNSVVFLISKMKVSIVSAFTCSFFLHKLPTQCSQRSQLLGHQTQCEIKCDFWQAMELSGQTCFIIHLHSRLGRVEVEMPFITIKDQNPKMSVEIDPLCYSSYYPSLSFQSFHTFLVGKRLTEKSGNSGTKWASRLSLGYEHSFCRVSRKN